MKLKQNDHFIECWLPYCINSMMSNICNKEERERKAKPQKGDREKQEERNAHRKEKPGEAVYNHGNEA